MIASEILKKEISVEEGTFVFLLLIEADCFLVSEHRMQCNCHKWIVSEQRQCDSYRTHNRRQLYSGCEGIESGRIQHTVTCLRLHNHATQLDIYLYSKLC